MRVARNLLFILALSATSLLTGCGGGGASQPSSPYDDVVFQAGASRAALEQLMSTVAEPWDWAGGAFDAPTDGAMLASDTPPTFAWHTDTSGTDPNSTSGAAPASTMTGPGYLLMFTSDPDTLLRVFTGTPSYTPDPSRWQQLGAAHAGLSVGIISAHFDGDTLVDGPYLGTPISFSIGSGS